MEMDTLSRPYYWWWKGIHIMPSPLLVVDKDTPCTSTLLVMERNTYYALLTAGSGKGPLRDTPCTSILLVMERDTYYFFH
jgi:hypothetical protein